MRYALALILLAAFPALAQDHIARQGDDEVVIREAPCTVASVLMRIPEAQREGWRRADARISGQKFFAFWRIVQSAVVLVYEDGDQGLIPAGAFKPVTEI